MEHRTDESVEAAARHLLAAHRGREPYRPLPAPLAPADLPGAYGVQQAFVDLLRGEAGMGPIAGYKIALTSKPMQEFCGVDHPLLGAIFASRIAASPATVSLADHQHVGIEFELAARLGRDVPASTEPYRAETVAPFVDALIPAFELIEDRNADYSEIEALTLVADNAWCAGVVLGTPVSDWRNADLVEGETRLVARDGEETSAIGAALGNPLNALAWAANTLGTQGRPLSAGMIVMTGSTMKTRFPEPGEHYRYSVAGLGAVELAVEA